MRTGIFVASLAFAAVATAQTFPGQEPKSMAPVRSASEAPATVRQPTPDRHQFSSPVMPIQIEGAGLSVPTGVERDSPYSPPPLPTPAPAAAKPPATEK
jgi:hypothetical protein